MHLVRHRRPRRLRQPHGSAPTAASSSLAYGAPDPNAPEGVGNLGNFIYVGTTAGQIYVTQNGGGSGAANNWLNISAGLDGSAVQQIITDPTRGSHDAYAVTTTGVFYIEDSILLANNPTNTADEWVNITGNIHNLAYSILGQTYDPTTDPNSTKYNQVSAFGLTSIAADWRYVIPNNPTNLSLGYHPVLYVGANSGVYLSLDNGQTWSLFPSTTFGAVAAGGNLPHVSVSSPEPVAGQPQPQPGMPDTAGPYNPANPAATPDPDLLMAATYGGANSPSTWRRCSSRPRSSLTRRHLRDRGRRHADRHDRHADHRRPQRDHRVRQRHLGHDRRRDPRRL